VEILNLVIFPQTDVHPPLFLLPDKPVFVTKLLPCNQEWEINDSTLFMYRYKKNELYIAIIPSFQEPGFICVRVVSL
jgi:hypothetical protein